MFVSIFLPYSNFKVIIRKQHLNTGTSNALIAVIYYYYYYYYYYIMMKSDETVTLLAYNLQSLFRIFFFFPEGLPVLFGSSK